MWGRNTIPLVQVKWGRRPRAWYMLAAACASAVLLAAGCGKASGPGAESSTAEPVPVEVEVLRKGPVARLAEAVGTVQSKALSGIQSKVVGQVTAVHVKASDVVSPGMLLIEIDDRDARAQAQKAESALNEARNALREAEDAIGASESARSEAEAASALATATYSRYKNLVENKAVSRQAFDEAESSFRRATAALSRAEQTLKSVEAKKDQATAAVTQATAGLDAAHVYLSYTKITSSVAGLVTSKTVDVGDMAAPGTTLLQIEDNRSYRLEAHVNEAQVARFRVGEPAVVVIDALGPAPLAGTVGEIVPAADPLSRTSVVKVDLPVEAQLRSGMFGRLQFSTGEKEALTVPMPAVVEKGQLTGVYVVEAGIARLRLIKLGNRYGDLVEALSGLNEGDTVVTQNVGQVSDGSRIVASRPEPQ